MLGQLLGLCSGQSRIGQCSGCDFVVCSEHCNSGRTARAAGTASRLYRGTVEDRSVLWLRLVICSVTVTVVG